MVVGRVTNPLEIARTDVPALRELRNPGVARCAVDLVDARTARQRPYQRVFAPASAHYEYVHFVSIPRVRPEFRIGQEGTRRSSPRGRDYTKGAKRV